MITYRSPTPEDVPALSRLSTDTFVETFGHLYAEADLRAFLAESCSQQAVARDLEDERRRLQVAEEDGDLVGFCKVSFGVRMPVNLEGRQGLELNQLYVRSGHHGTAVAPTLMSWALAQARAHGAEDVVLSVYADNVRAQRFYRRYGFEDVGPYFFMVGNHRDEERLFRLRLAEL